MKRRIGWIGALFFVLVATGLWAPWIDRRPTQASIGAAGMAAGIVGLVIALNHQPTHAWKQRMKIRTAVLGSKLPI